MSTPTHTKWYHFSQNNSGGSFVTEPANGIGTDVIIEAVDALHANARAESIGIYFYGCDAGRDCDCCGDRWSKADESDAEPVPSIYNTPVEKAQTNWFRKDAFIHPLTGKFYRLDLQKEETR